MRYRAGYGTLANADQRRAALQDLFLRVLSRVVPEVWADLGRRLEAAGGLKRLSSADREAIIEDWASALNLDVPWIRKNALKHLADWERFPELAGVGGVHGTVVGGALPWIFPVVEIPAYDPSLETREVYLARVRTLVESHMDEVEQAYRGDGSFRRAPANRDEEAFEWVVAYQVKGESLSLIAQRLSGNADARRSSVWHALRRLSDDLDLPLRLPGLKGRKKKEPRR